MIKIQNIAKKFDDRWIFRNLNLEIKDQESVAIIGPSGSGKSVLMKVICGLLQPDEGTVTLGHPEIGMLFQKNALFDSFTVEENLLFPLKERLRIEGLAAKERAANLLKAVGLEGSENLYPDELSGGMQKRLGIARALIVEPKILLYDEPTAGLDPITSKMIAQLIRELKTQVGSTLLVITNDVQRAYQLADRIFLLAQGKLSGGQPPADIKATSDPAIRQFIYGLKEGPLTSGLA